MHGGCLWQNMRCCIRSASQMLSGPEFHWIAYACSRTFERALVRNRAGGVCTTIRVDQPPSSKRLRRSRCSSLLQIIRNPTQPDARVPAWKL